MKLTSTATILAITLAGAFAYNAVIPKPKGTACCANPYVAAVNAKAAPPAKPAPKVQRKLIAYYFHGNYRCTSCRTIEAWTKKAIQDNFVAELKSYRLEWRVINVETPGNDHFMKDYKLYTKSVVLSDVRNGNEVHWKNLDKVWTLLRDETAFKNYIRDEVRASLKAK